ncbi:MAG TPA: hypothetical protein VGI99_05530 [Gemmataceae bacterium]|jgi:hypothetical protein
MIQTLEAVVDSTGRVQILGKFYVPSPRRALVTVLDEPAELPGEAALLAEAALADWARPEEDAAWSHLQPAK